VDYIPGLELETIFKMMPYMLERTEPPSPLDSQVIGGSIRKRKSRTFKKNNRKSKK
jgi:hypothetical protein